MSELELKRKIIKVKIDGQEYQLKAPRVKEFKEFCTAQKAVNDENASDFLASSFEKLGLPKEVFAEFEAEHIELLIKELFPSKKN